MIRSFDGITVNTEGSFRVMYIGKEFYVVGNGNVYPVESAQEGATIIKNLKELGWLK